MKVVLLGYGIENQAVERFLRDLPRGIEGVYGFSKDDLTQAEYEIISEIDGDIEVSGDLIVRTPSLPPRFIKVVGDGIMTSGTKLFYEVFPREKIIGVTGTKGKGTTSTIITELLRAKGLEAETIGNIGKPALDFIRDFGFDTWAVYETSSFQAWDIKKSPARAVLLRVEADHLDKHETMENYIEAKKNLVRFQHGDDKAVIFESHDLSILNIEHGQKYPGEFFVRDGFFWRGEQRLVSVDEVKLEGSHNHENALAALSIVWDLIDGDDVYEVMKKAFNNLKSLPHRMENLGLIGGVEVIDDNFSASMPSLDVATRTLSDKNKKYVLIAGGFDRKLDNYHEIANILKREFEKGFLQKVFLIGETASKIAEHLPSEVEFEIMPSDNFEVAVKSAFDLAKENKAVLLMSPGAPSFDMFKNFEERANKFQEVLREGQDFTFLNYEFDEQKLLAEFKYRVNGIEFNEKITFARNNLTDDILQKYPCMIEFALQLCRNVIGVSYYKTFPSKTVRFEDGQKLDKFQADFLSKVYQEGLSEFAYKNKLRRDELAHFASDDSISLKELSENYQGAGTLSMQSGGKDSLLVAKVLQENSENWSPFFVDINGNHPAVLDELGKELVVVKREVDFVKLKEAEEKGAMNGHVPITLILSTIAVMQAILLGKDEVIFAVAHEGEEAHDVIKSENNEPDLLVRHQWSKTFAVEKDLQEWVRKYISGDIKVGSILRQFSEMKLMEEFIQRAWKDFGHRFSSCNRANYRMGTDNRELKWCGNCAKCANMFLIMAPFLEAQELKDVFGGQDLLAKESLFEDFKGLLGIEGAIKPFECVGEVDELRLAYKMAKEKHGDNLASLPFEVPEPDPNYNYKHEYEAQEYFLKRSKELFGEAN